MLIREMQGLKRIELSQAVPYALVNGGQDSGASIDSILQVLMKTGAPPVSVVSEYDWRGYPDRRIRKRGCPLWPKDWREQSAPYRIVEAGDCPTYQHMLSAIAAGFPTLLGLDWDNQPRAGHAMGGVGYYQDDDSELFNPWGGDKSFSKHTQRQCERGIQKYGCWYLRVAKDPPNDGDL
jgi:hypothetical protein